MLFSREDDKELLEKLRQLEKKAIRFIVFPFVSYSNRRIELNFTLITFG